MIPKSNQTCLETFNETISMIFDFIHPFIAKSFNRKSSHVLSDIIVQSMNLLEYITYSGASTISLSFWLSWFLDIMTCCILAIFGMMIQKLRYTHLKWRVFKFLEWCTARLLFVLPTMHMSSVSTFLISVASYDSERIFFIS